jgi:hypothetical protein
MVDHAEAEKDLELFFAASSGTWGLHGTGFEGGAAVVWDAKRVRDAHARLWAGRFAADHETLWRVTPTVQAFRRRHVAHWSTAAAVYAPRRWPALLGAVMARGARRGNLTGLLLDSVRLYGMVKEATPLAMLRLAETRASAMETDPAIKRRFFAPLIAEAEAKLKAALEAYDVLRRERGRAEAGAKRAVVDGLRAVFG